MRINQFAVYQIKESAEYRHLRFLPYEKLLEKGLQVDVGNYEQVYLSQMVPGESAEQIWHRLKHKHPRTLKGHAISVSDVLVVNQNGTISSYYINTDRLVPIAEFLRLNSSGTLVTMETKNYLIKGKPGTWLATDDVEVDGKQFFLMQNEQMKNAAACTVVDEKGDVVVSNTNRFDEETMKQIRDYLHPPQPEQPPPEQKPPLENWQKSFENGEYLRAAEMTEEQNYSFIDGRMNNMPFQKDKDGKRPSVLKRLREKQAAIAVRSGKPVPQMTMEQEAERNRK